MVNNKNLQIGMVMIRGCRCRCGHEWRPHNIQERPATCPQCKAANGDKPRRKARIMEEKTVSARHS